MTTLYINNYVSSQEYRIANKTTKKAHLIPNLRNIK